MKNLILIAMALLFTSLEVYSQDFAAHLKNGDKLYFHVTDTARRNVEIIRPNALNESQVSLPSGHLEIPSTVKYKDKVYYVMAIGNNAFADADGITSVTIPSSILSIGESAFSGCRNLESIIFPSCKPKIGSKAFDYCKALSSVSFGSDWTSIELQMFASSESLTAVFIPARVVKLTGVKQLPSLQRIDVDANSKAFSSREGMLYSKDGKTFYACPNARMGDVAILDGTEKILDEAFKGCTLVKSLLLPASIREFAFDEFASCTSLTRIIMNSEIPPMTAKWDGSTVFSLKAPTQNTVVYVPGSLLKRYRTTICNKTGTYETLQGKRAVTLNEVALTGKQAIRKTPKSF